MNGVSALIRRGMRDIFLSAIWGYKENTAICKLGRGPSPNAYADTLMTQFQPPDL